VGNIRRCTKCQGRLFLELDYYDKSYDFICISCGHNEPLIAVEKNIQTNLPHENSSRIQ
jgi:hypothetical protein